MDNKNNSFVYVVFLVLFLANHAWSAENQSLYSNNNPTIAESNGQENSIANINSSNLNSLEETEILLKIGNPFKALKNFFVKLFHKNPILTAETSNTFYNNSTPISLVNDKVSQAFEIIKKDLNINEPVELRVIPKSIYKKHNNIDVLGFFAPNCPGVIYIIKETLTKHPIFIVFVIVHELEHYRQFQCYPDSFAWTQQNKEFLGDEEFYRQLEYGADKRAAEYFKCAASSFIFACGSNYLFKDPKGYFSVTDALPYFFKNFFLSSKGRLKNSNDILDYLPSSGVYWNRVNIILTGFTALCIYSNYISSPNIIK